MTTIGFCIWDIVTAVAAVILCSGAWLWLRRVRQIRREMEEKLSCQYADRVQIR